MTKSGFTSTHAAPAKSAWAVEFHDEFDPEFDAMAEDVRDGLLAAARAVEILGPHAGRPHVDTLDGSKHANMKERRFGGHDGNEEWRAAFAFDPERKAVVLVAGDKKGKSQAKLYKKLIAKADKRFDSHLKSIKGPRKGR